MFEPLIAKDLDQLSEVAQFLLKKIIPDHHILCFYGTLGAGKTTLIREICRQMGVNDTVTSPTFSLVNEYQSADNEPIYHFDFYRINNPSEAYDFGYEEYLFSGNLCLIEWPEKIEELLPKHALKIWIEVGEDDERIIRID